MREIKFRLWNGSAMEYGGFCVHAAGGLTFSQLSRGNEKSPVMQFTDQKDSKGAEIFEGDVIDKKYKRSVYFNGAAFWAGNVLLDHWLRKRKTAGAPSEVIGNIHENPELLKA